MRNKINDDIKLQGSHNWFNLESWNIMYFIFICILAYRKVVTLLGSAIFDSHCKAIMGKLCVIIDCEFVNITCLLWMMELKALWINTGPE